MELSKFNHHIKLFEQHTFVTKQINEINKMISEAHKGGIILIRHYQNAIEIPIDIVTATPALLKLVETLETEKNNILKKIEAL